MISPEEALAKYSATATLTLDDWNWITAMLLSAQTLGGPSYARILGEVRQKVLEQIDPVIKEFEEKEEVKF